MSDRIRYTKETAPLCNLCRLTTWVGPDSEMACSEANGLIDAHASGGYESTPGNGHGALDDITTYHFSLCEFCLDWLFSKFMLPVKMTDYMT